MCILIFHQLECVIIGCGLALCIFNYYFSRIHLGLADQWFRSSLLPDPSFIGFLIFPASDCLIFLLLYKTGSIKSSFVLLSNSYLICIFMQWVTSFFILCTFVKILYKSPRRYESTDCVPSNNVSMEIDITNFFGLRFCKIWCIALANF